MAKAEELSHPSSIADVRSYRFTVHELCGDTQAALAEAEAYLSLAREQGLSQLLGEATAFRGWALAETGQPADGIRQIREGMAGMLAARMRILVPYQRAHLADAYGRGNRPKAERLRQLTKAITAVGNQTRALVQRGAVSSPGRGPGVRRRSGPGRRRSGLPARHCGRPLAEYEAVGAAGGDEPRPPVARPGDTRRSVRSPRPGLRLVHRGLRSARPAEREGAARHTPLSTTRTTRPTATSTSTPTLTQPHRLTLRTDGGGDNGPIAKGLHEAVDGVRAPAQCLGAMTASPNARMPSTVCRMVGSQAAPDR